MNKEDARLLILDFVYGELNSAQEQELLNFISKHDDLQAELEELQSTRNILSHMPTEKPVEKFIMMEASKPDKKAKIFNLGEYLSSSSAFFKYTAVAASFLLLFFVLGAATNMNITIDDSGFALRFGEVQSVDDGFSQEQVAAIINEIQKENALLVAQVAQDVKTEQELKLEQAIMSFANYFEDQRESDLRLLSTGLSSLQETTYNRFIQTDRVLGEIIQTVNIEN